jgi:hypothetical protein
MTPSFATGAAIWLILTQLAGQNHRLSLHRPHTGSLWQTEPPRALAEKLISCIACSRQPREVSSQRYISTALQPGLKLVKISRLYEMKVKAGIF